MRDTPVASSLVQRNTSSQVSNNGVMIQAFGLKVVYSCICMGVCFFHRRVYVTLRMCHGYEQIAVGRFRENKYRCLLRTCIRACTKLVFYIHTDVTSECISVF